MAHEWVVIALSVVVSICSGLVVRLLRHLDDLEDAKEKHAREIRDTRMAISRLEGHCDLPPFPYTND